MQVKLNILKKVKDKKYYVTRSLLTRISPELNTKYIFKKEKGQTIDLVNPKTFDEKISWLKLYKYSDNKLVTQCADKLAVRDYVSQTGNEHLLNELYGVYSTVDEINWSELPNEFVIKWTVGAGGNLICVDKSKLEPKNSINKLKKFSNNKYHLISSEMHYKDITPQLICEKLLTTESCHLPEDYKIYCFNGKPQLIMACIGRETGKPKFYFFDTEWQLQRINKDGLAAGAGFTVEKPENFELMLKYAEDLSAPFPFVRVDLYNIQGEIIFGELTFTPAAGIDGNLSQETDLLLGNMLELPSA